MLFIEGMFSGMTEVEEKTRRRPHSCLLEV
jgi:hypothetical protein